MNNDVRWDQIRYFLTVADAGSAAAAAQRLGVSHATVMRNIAQLEASLGVRLFDHVRTGYRITDDGEDVLQNARAMEEHAETLLRQATGRNPAPAGKLKLALADASLFDAMPLLRDFQREHPRIELVLQHDPSSAAARLAQLHVDAAVLVTNTPPDDLVGRQLGRIQLRFCAAPSYLESRSGAAAEDQAWIVWRASDAGELSEAWQRAQLQRLTPRPRVVLETDQHASALAAVRAGIGVALLNEQSASGLRALRFAAPRESLGIWLLTHPDLRRAGRVRALFDYIASPQRAR